MIKLIGLIPLFPLIGFLINGFFGKKISKGLSGTIAATSILASFILAVGVFMQVNSGIEKLNSGNQEEERKRLFNEANELTAIFTATLKTLKNKSKNLNS